MVDSPTVAEGDPKVEYGTIVRQTATPSNTSEDLESSRPNNANSLKSKRAFWAWLLVCFSTGPTNGVANRYIPAVLQSVANAVGHVPGTNERCATRGKIVCVVPFGTGVVDYNSYILYLQAISRSIEGVLTILIAGIADYGHYRKNLMIVSIILFGTFALPFASFNEKSYENLVTYSALWLTLAAVSAAYGTIESSYIPLFMRESGWFDRKTTTTSDSTTSAGNELRHKAQINIGTRASVLSLVAGNLGSILSLLIGVIIANTSRSGPTDGYRSFLIAITVGGALTVALGAIGWFFVPSVRGAKPPSRNLAFLALKNQLSLLKSFRRYPEPFKLCIGWVLWNTANSNFQSVLGLAFREVSGLGTGDRLYTVYSFLGIVLASIGSLSWMFLYPVLPYKMKTYAYFFLTLHVLWCLWGTFGISDNVPIGFKHTGEFWGEIALLNPATSALRACNRVMYAAMIPRGKEAHFTGLELTLDLATGWINPLVQSVIQDATHNLRYPMLPNLFLFLVSSGFYFWFDMDKGIEDSMKPWDEDVAEEQS
ncbi:autophagy-related protein 22 [Xylaria bambusicola]|uniref:autophagy-related protein 22 n=1 Tax=Xylaria bambusicola TaxID=326684 RepID=UPI00200888A9|nr:autophagy-related protein 22 [Xylaria bambusicola]KAI0522110.1 autophagy-related protein 22 [Xylaria bambusicola]